jgi:hypothetical protein
MRFYLGTHEPAWLPRTDVPLFVSFNRLIRRNALPRASGKWALDSGAFTQLHRHGRWTISAINYAEAVGHIASHVGKLQWASIQDWLCAPAVLKSTGLTIRQHQKNTVRSLMDLRTIAPGIKWVPILQGWDARSYLQHMAAYRAEGFNLEDEPLVGVGSLANRKDSPEVHRILSELHGLGLRTHGFGLSTIALGKVHRLLSSADSLTWSFIARRRLIKHVECTGAHAVCNNCLPYALSWRAGVLKALQKNI